MRVAVDVDGVLADRVGGVLDRIERRYGVRIAREDVDEWGYTIPGTGVGINEVIHEAAGEPGHLRGLAPIDGAVEGVRALADDHEVLIATHRDPGTHDRTREWLADHGVPYDRFVEDPGPAKTAAPADVLIDDYDRTVRRFARERGRAVLFRQPWNDAADATDADGVAAAAGWAAVLEAVDSMADGRDSP